MLSNDQSVVKTVDATHSLVALSITFPTKFATSGIPACLNEETAGSIFGNLSLDGFFCRRATSMFSSVFDGPEIEVTVFHLPQLRAVVRKQILDENAEIYAND